MASRDDDPVCCLPRFFGLPGGMTPDQALARAELTLELHRAEMMAAVDAAIIETHEAVETAAPEQSLACARIAVAAETIHGVAGAYGFPDLSRAAAALLAHVEDLRARQQWDVGGLRLFADALTCLRGASTSPVCREVVEGLRRLIGRSLDDPPPKRDA